MKKIFYLITVLLVVLILFGCKNGKSGSSAEEENFDKVTSYALGMNLGVNIKDNLERDGIFPNMNEFLKGFKDGLTGDLKMDEIEAMELLETAFNELTEEKNNEAMRNEITFLAENARKPGIIITSSGLQYEVITETGGPKPSYHNMIRVHYEARLSDGTIFDSSYDFGEPIELPLDEGYPGWTEGLLLMGVGSKYIFYVPSEQGYGSRGIGPIPPYSTLVFTIDLLDIIE